MTEQNPSQANDTGSQTNPQSQGNGQQPQGNGHGGALPPPSSSSSPQPQQAPPSSSGPQPTPSGAPTRLPIIRLIPGDLPLVVNEAEAALIAAGGRNIYKRGDALVRPTRMRIPAAGGRKTYSWQMVNVSKTMVVEEFTTVARFEKITKGGKVTDKDCPDYVAETYLARIGRWKLLDLVGIISTPFFRNDGSLCQKPGYDPASALVYMPNGTTFPSIPSQPTKADAQAALKRLKGALFTEFPFITNIDRAVALSALFTALSRSSIDAAPLHSFTAPSPGTGKSYLIDVIAILATGYAAPVISQGHTDEEFEKRIDACLIAGDQIVSIDNCHRALDSDKLCQALTQPQLRIRYLGYSRNISVPVVSLFFANGNNLVIAADLTRRTLLSCLDAKMERPELRKFKGNPIAVARQQRGELVVAALTILQAWIISGEKNAAKPLAGYEEWSQRVREPLIWLDEEDPCKCMDAVWASDPYREQLTTVLAQWRLKLIVGQPYTIKQVIERAMVDQDFFNALAAVASNTAGTAISSERLGRWLHKNVGKIVDGHRLEEGPRQASGKLWQCCKA